MSTPAQIAANQANSRLSTGPVTPEGKTASSRNNYRHGFRAATLILSADDQTEFDDILQELTDHFDPEDLTDERFIREMADAEFRLRRCREDMQFALERQIRVLSESDNAATEPGKPGLTRRQYEALAIETMGDGKTGGTSRCSWSTWLRYETKYERQYERAYKAWTQYKKDLATFKRRQAADEQKAIHDFIFGPMPDQIERAKARMASTVQNQPAAPSSPATGVASNVQNPASTTSDNPKTVAEFEKWLKKEAA